MTWSVDPNGEFHKCDHCYRSMNDNVCVFCGYHRNPVTKEEKKDWAKIYAAMDKK